MEMQRMSDYFSSCSSFVSLIPTVFDFGSFMCRTHFNRSWWPVCHDLPRQSSRILLICAYRLLSTLALYKAQISWLLWVFDAKYLTR
jgi:hypothetical protein